MAGYHPYFYKRTTTIVPNPMNATLLPSGVLQPVQAHGVSWDNPSARDPRFRLKRIHGGAGAGMTNATEKDAGTFEYATASSIADMMVDVSSIVRSSNAEIVVNGCDLDVVNVSRGNNLFGPIACIVTDVNLGNAASDPSWQAITRAAERREGDERYFGELFKYPDVDAYGWIATATIPSWSRCIDTGKELVWIYRGSNKFNGSASTIATGWSAYQPNKGFRGDGLPFTECTLYPHDKDPKGAVNVELPIGVDGNMMGTRKAVWQGIKGRTNWSDDTTRGGRFVYALVVPHSGGYDRAWDTEIELSNAMAQDMYPTVRILSDGRIDCAHFSVLRTDGPSQRLVLNLQAKSFTLEARDKYVAYPQDTLQAYDQIASRYWERQIMTTMNGTRVAIFPYEGLPGGEACLWVGISDPATGHLRNLTSLSSILTVAATTMDPLPLGVREPPRLILEGDTSEDNFWTSVTWGEADADGNPTFTLEPYPVHADRFQILPLTVPTYLDARLIQSMLLRRGAIDRRRACWGRTNLAIWSSRWDNYPAENKEGTLAHEIGFNQTRVEAGSRLKNLPGGSALTAFMLMVKPGTLSTMEVSSSDTAGNESVSWLNFSDLSVTIPNGTTDKRHRVRIWAKDLGDGTFLVEGLCGADVNFASRAYLGANPTLSLGFDGTATVWGLTIYEDDMPQWGFPIETEGETRYHTDFDSYDSVRGIIRLTTPADMVHAHGPCTSTDGITWQAPLESVPESYSPRELLDSEYTYANGIITLSPGVIPDPTTGVIHKGRMCTKVSDGVYRLPAFDLPVWLNPPTGGSLQSLGNRTWKLVWGSKALPTRTNRWLVHGDFDCSMRSATTMSTSTSKGTSYWLQTSNLDDQGLKYWTYDSTQRAIEGNVHKDRCSAFVVDLSNVDRVDLGLRAVIVPDRVAWVIPWSTPDTPAAASEPILVDLEVPEDGIVTLHTYTSFVFDLCTKDALESVLTHRNEGRHRSLSLRLKAGTYTLKVGQNYTKTYGWVMPRNSAGSFVIDCGYWEA